MGRGPKDGHMIDIFLLVTIASICIPFFGAWTFIVAPLSYFVATLIWILIGGGLRWSDC